MAVCNVSQCDFGVFIKRGNHVAKVDFDEKFSKSVINTVIIF